MTRDTNLAKILKENVFTFIQDTELSVSDFCEMHNLSKTVVYDLDIKLPSISNAIKIAKSVNLTLEYLFGRTQKVQDYRELDSQLFYKNLKKLLTAKNEKITKMCNALEFSSSCLTN